jgi:hypothetical protein
MAVLCLTSFLILWAALAILVSESYSICEYAFVFINTFGLLLAITAFGFLCSVIWSSRQTAVTLSFGAVLLSFVLYKGLSAFNKAQWLARLTLFYYADPTKILVRGTLDWTDGLALIGITTGLLAVSLVLFEGKDITVS